MELGSFPTSLIPTSGATATRAADVATMPADYDVNEFTAINQDFGVAGGSDTLTIIGNGEVAKRAAVYDSQLTQTEINALAEVNEWWEFRVLGETFAFDAFVANGQLTVDWGDGTVETLTTSEHTFLDGGGYHTIKVRLDSGTNFRPKIGNSSTHRDKLIAVGPVPEGMEIDFSSAFKSCTNLLTFDGRSTVRSGSNISTAFQSCTSLLSLPFIDTANVTSFNAAFEQCSSVTRIPLYDTSSVTDFTDAFRTVSSVTEVSWSAYVRLRGVRLLRPLPARRWALPHGPPTRPTRSPG